MKKIIALAIVAVSMVSASFALDLSIGVRGNAGINIAANEDVATKVNASLNKDTAYDLGFGVNVNFALLGSLGLQGEANFVTSKASFNDATKNQTVEYETILLDMPVMLWLNLDLWRFVVGFGVGPNFSTTINQLSDIQGVKNNTFKVGIAAGLDGKFFITDHLGIVASVRYIMDFEKTSVPIVIEGYNTGVEYPSVEFPRRSIYGGIGIEWKFF